MLLFEMVLFVLFLINLTLFIFMLDKMFILFAGGITNDAVLFAGGITNDAVLFAGGIFFIQLNLL